MGVLENLNFHIHKLLTLLGQYGDLGTAKMCVVQYLILLTIIYLKNKEINLQTKYFLCIFYFCSVVLTTTKFRAFLTQLQDDKLSIILTLTRIQFIKTSIDSNFVGRFKI